MTNSTLKFIRYPGGKQRLLQYLIPYLPQREEIKGYFIEPFVGSGAVFFAISPKKAILSDINPTLIDLYLGLQKHPLAVWNIFRRFPSTKEGYYQIRDFDIKMDLTYRAARALYLNRTCFKGMWRENANGQFNVGYGGEDRRWVINKEALLMVSRFLKKAKLLISDFEEIIGNCIKDDFIFLDPPYKPGEKELKHNHYIYIKFTFNDHNRLAIALKKATDKGVLWAMTLSSHQDILELYKNTKIIPIKKGTGSKPGLLTSESGEVLVRNY
jgi:DNA adenine methylase